MIKEKTEETAALYVLDLLSEQEHVAFEAAMAESAELRRYVRELSSGLHEPLKSLEGPSRPDLLPAILARTGDARPPASAVAGKNSRILSSAVPWSIIWASAAALFLVLNLVLLFVLSEQSSVRASDLVAADSSESRPVAPGSRTGGGGDRLLLESRVERLEEELDDARATLAESREEQTLLERENAEVKAFNSEWREEYARLAARFLPFFEPNNGLGRFTVIEMVDAEAFEQDLPRRGFADLAGRFLTGEGNIAGINPNDFVGPLVEGAGASNARLDTAGTVLMPVAGAGEQDAASDEEAITEEVPQRESSRPTGFTVWRDDEQKGFLDLYNLPSPPEGREAFLWVRSSELDPYIPVGNLPALENGTGSLFYSVDEPNFTPADILITAEPEGGSGSAPAGTILLRGP